MTNGGSKGVQAQATAARTFALKNIGRHSADGFDLCDTTHCQLYDEKAINANTDKALKETFGEAVLFDGKLINAVFHTDAGGMTENSEDVWGTALPYLRAVREEKQGTMPWTKKFSPQGFAKIVGIEKPRKIELSPFTFGKSVGNDRSESGRVKTITIVGDDEKKTFDGTEFRSLFSLPSTLFSVTVENKSIVIKGFGAGHGLGLSQHGAKTLAESGKDYREILRHYYRDITLKKIY